MQIFIKKYEIGGERHKYGLEKIHSMDLIQIYAYGIFHRKNLLFVTLRQPAIKTISQRNFIF